MSPSHLKLILAGNIQPFPSQNFTPTHTSSHHHHHPSSLQTSFHRDEHPFPSQNFTFSNTSFSPCISLPHSIPMSKQSTARPDQLWSRHLMFIAIIASQLSTQLTHFELHALLILLCPTTTPLYPTPTLSTPHLKLPTLTLSISAGRRATLKRTVPINSSH